MHEKEPGEDREQEERNQKNNIAWSISAWHMTLSLHSVFTSHNNTSIDAAVKTLIDEGGFGILDSRVCRRGWIGPENGCTSDFDLRVEINVKDEIEWRDCMKAMPCALCSMHMTVTKYEKMIYSTRHSRLQIVSDLVGGSMWNALGCGWLPMVGMSVIMMGRRRICWADCLFNVLLSICWRNGIRIDCARVLIRSVVAVGFRWSIRWRLIPWSGCDDS